ncbi:pimeloyl-ACP methyl ester carboxylesterase [Kribbella sp. VKM Ac-2527]|uniref:Pimeloyl-ACP methyl ester carboxylesterase n=1 Tax=Kribbella caucasensis TaxID=2512215 RepID=A0A4R6K7X9_9ACTN|nr:alpha/beta hydrolase [Kribbella sp. VKM Ac-2527]TDO45113.1 pimeloyl-ACP methyl ester carboxylesterase [Kribbella sp. VKM Ac-2527]
MNSKRPHPRALTVLVAILAMVLTAVTPAAASDSGGPKPTVVLVHGAWADGSSWAKVTSRLQDHGYPVRVPPNPLRSLSNDAATIRNFLSTMSGPIVLVGHSYGGAVITNAATGNPNVKALVYVDAFAPAQGEMIFPLAGADSALAVDPTTVFDFVPYPGAPAGDVDLYLKHDTFVTSFASGVPRREAENLYPSQRPLTLSAGNEPSGTPAYATIPSWYVLGTGDRIITPSAQEFMALRAHATITRVATGHLGLVSNPSAITKVIERAAQATR